MLTGSFPCLKSLGHLKFSNPHKKFTTLWYRCRHNYFSTPLFFKREKNHVNAAICHLHIHHNIPCLLPKISHNLCYCFLQGITVVPREKKTACAKILFLGGRGWGEQGIFWKMCKWQTDNINYQAKWDICVKFRKNLLLTRSWTLSLSINSWRLPL